MFCSNLTAQNKMKENDSILIWHSDKKINWDNFLSEKETFSGHFKNSGAEISVGVSVFPKEVTCSNKTELKFIAIMSKNESLSVFKNDKLLNHEQRHFDIAEIYSRKMRKSLKRILAENNECDLQLIVDTFYQLRDELDQTQYLYDKEIRISGKEDDNQKKWNKKIDSLLNIYSEYEKKYYIEDLELD